LSWLIFLGPRLHARLDRGAVRLLTRTGLAARAEGIGMGWVSILDPRTIAAVLEVPPDWKLIGYFWLGFPEAEGGVPALQRLRWEERRPAASFLLRR
jgi:5,6-dimethylbenzimidazole synthase